MVNPDSFREPNPPKVGYTQISPKRGDTAKMAGRAAELPKWQISKYRAKKVWHTFCYEHPNIILT